MERRPKLDSASVEEARAILSASCGSSRWVDRMLARRPFGGHDALLKAARDEWLALSPEDWLEAFSHHPKIGDRTSLAVRFPATYRMSEREQAGVGGAPADVISALAEANHAYAERFGFIFIVCASGKSATEMLQLLRARLNHDRDTELRIAADEQAKITAIRLSA